jgi:hypothetical protein
MHQGNFQYTFSFKQNKLNYNFRGLIIIFYLPFLHYLVIYKISPKAFCQYRYYFPTFQLLFYTILQLCQNFY